MSALTKALFVVLGVVLVLASLDILSIPPGQLHTSPAVLFATGLVFLLIGLLAFVQPEQTRHPHAYRFVLALLTTSFPTVTALIAFYSHDEKLFVGPFVFSGPRVDAFGKVVLGSGALLLAGAAAWCWTRYWRGRGGTEAEPM